MQDFDVVITSGGVGPTHDDITILAVARALNQAVRENKVRCGRGWLGASERRPWVAFSTRGIVMMCGCLGEQYFTASAVLLSFSITSHQITSRDEYSRRRSSRYHKTIDRMDVMLLFPTISISTLQQFSVILNCCLDSKKFQSQVSVCN